MRKRQVADNRDEKSPKQRAVWEEKVSMSVGEICDMIAGGVFAADETRFDASIRAGLPYIGSCGALDMVNFGAPDTVPCGKVARSTSTGPMPGARTPDTPDTMCITWL